MPHYHYLVQMSEAKMAKNDRAEFIKAMDTIMQEYSESEFEVITETYNWGRAVFQGWLRTEGDPVHCIMNIYFKGDMVYIVDEG